MTMQRYALRLLATLAPSGFTYTMDTFETPDGDTGGRQTITACAYPLDDGEYVLLTDAEAWAAQEAERARDTSASLDVVGEVVVRAQAQARADAIRDCIREIEAEKPSLRGQFGEYDSGYRDASKDTFDFHIRILSDLLTKAERNASPADDETGAQP